MATRKATKIRRICLRTKADEREPVGEYGDADVDAVRHAVSGKAERRQAGPKGAGGRAEDAGRAADWEALKDRVSVCCADSSTV